MSAANYKDLAAHAGHKIECVIYGEEYPGEGTNVALECVDCNVVLLDFDSEGEE